MDEQPFVWRKAIIIISVVALLTIGVGIIIYVTVARDRIAPTPTLEAGGTLSVTPSAPGTPGATSSATVVGLVREYSPGALIIVLTPIEGDVEQIIVTEAVRVTTTEGKLASVQGIGSGATIYAEGDLDALGRMVARQIVIMEAAQTPTSTLSETPVTPTLEPTEESTPTPPVTPLGAWSGEYYSNVSLAGTPAVVREDAAIDFAWGHGSPHQEIPVDGFSVRWVGRWPFDQGSYRFYAYSDDGVRVWVNGAPVIDQWQDQAAALSSSDITLPAGEHDVRVEYYDGTGDAQVRVWWEYRGAYPEWKAEYYANTGLEGEPVLVRNDASIDMAWGQDPPAPQVPADGFSVRWTRIVTFEEGPYRFSARADDGIRVWVDDVLLINEWHQARPDVYAGDIWLDSGPHALRVEYYDAGGEALARLTWQRTEGFQAWRGEYYANSDLNGRPAFVRDDAAIQFDWGEGSAGPGLPVDGFSARWQRVLALEAGTLRFRARADDGVRIYVDGVMVVDGWQLQGQPHTGQVVLASGDHTIAVEYCDRGGRAFIDVDWELLSPTPTAIASPPSATPETEASTGPSTTEIPPSGAVGDG